MAIKPNALHPFHCVCQNGPLAGGYICVVSKAEFVLLPNLGAFIAPAPKVIRACAPTNLVCLAVKPVVAPDVEKAIGLIADWAGTKVLIVPI